MATLGATLSPAGLLCSPDLDKVITDFSVVTVYLTVYLSLIPMVKFVAVSSPRHALGIPT
jgi:hypothetical protein